MTKNEIMARLDELEIEYDASDKKAVLAELLPEDERPQEEPKKSDTSEFVVQRDFWDAAGDRHRKGLVMTLTAAEAIDGVESGHLKRK